MEVNKPKTVWNRYKKNLIPRFIEIAFILFTIFLFKPNTWFKFGLIFATATFIIGLSKSLYLRRDIKPQATFKSFIKSFVIGSILFVMWTNLRGWSILIGIVIVAAWKIYQQKDLYLETIRSTADLIEGKK